MNRDATWELFSKTGSVMAYLAYKSEPTEPPVLAAESAAVCQQLGWHDESYGGGTCNPQDRRG